MLSREAVKAKKKYKRLGGLIAACLSNRKHPT